VQRDLREFSSRWEPSKGRFCFYKSEVLISLQGISVAEADLVVQFQYICVDQRNDAVICIDLLPSFMENSHLYLFLFY
jgi:hypothetical protein